MRIERWNPSVRWVACDAVNSLSRRASATGRCPARTGSHHVHASWALQRRRTTVVTASMPGIRPEDADHSPRPYFTIRGDSKVDEEQQGHNWLVRERRAGSFQRSVNLGTPINADKASAQFENGVLTLTLPKSEQARPRQINISVR